MSRIFSRVMILFPCIITFACTSPGADSDWDIYSNNEHQFSIQHPKDLEVIPSQYGPSFMVGEKINIMVSDMNPLDCHGDCPVIEYSKVVTLAGQEAEKVEGYLGAAGGFIPQQYVSYVLKRNNQYYRFTLYSLSIQETSEDMSTIRPLKKEDVELFEQMMATLKFIN